MQDLKIAEMSKEEYFYLTENLELVNEETIRNGVGYILYNKRKKLLDVVEQVMQNELTEEERKLATDYWSESYSLGEISARNNIARSAIYRRLEGIKKKLETSLKYVLIYDSSVLPHSTSELMSFVKEKNFEQRKIN
ncbi:MAG: hypothetical protein IKW34_04030 [Clostridia bacterium]|nr:hypothetical protein [Clostridia bacterium]